MSRARRPKSLAKFAAYSLISVAALGLAVTYMIGRYAGASFWSAAPALGGALILLYLAQLAAANAASKPLIQQSDDVQRSGDEAGALYEYLKSSYLKTLILLDQILAGRDGLSGAHSARIRRLAHKMAGRLALVPGAHRRIENACRLHDIGNVGVSEQVLLKPGPLDETAMTEMRKHVEIGADIIRSVPFLADAAEIILHHHERFDGSGYPHGLAGDAIPIEARILSVVDAFDAMTSVRPYRPALATDAAALELISGGGGQFDPGVVNLFLLYLAEDEGVTLPPEDELRPAA